MLRRVATEQILRQAQVTAAADTFGYEPIAPLWLTKGSQYVLEVFSPQGDDAYYYALPTTTNAALTFLDMRYCNGCTASTFPTNVLGTAMNYGLPDALFFTRKEVDAEPEQLAAGFASTATCNADGSAASCGDGKLNPDALEACDDGNTLAGDGCSATCTIEPPPVVDEPDAATVGERDDGGAPDAEPIADGGTRDEANTADADVSRGDDGCNVGGRRGGWATAALGIAVAVLAAGRRRRR